MSSLITDLRNWIPRYFAKVLAQGPIPEHIVLCMDGNRRWARQKGLETTEGHRKGEVTMVNLFSFLVQVGVKEVTLFVFSIENFKRTPEEVDYLMDQFEEFFDKILKGDTKRHRMIGNRKLLRESLQRKMDQVEEATHNNTEIIVNWALGYSCRDDITQGIKRLMEQKNKRISAEELSDQMYTQPLKDVDMFLRTSGETRFSDGFMWESDRARICFVEKLWPDINYLDMMWILLRYQIMELKGKESKYCFN